MKALISGLILLLACCFSSILCTSAYSQDSVGWFVQLSDIHVNKYVHHEIVPDLLEFSNRVIASVKPGAILITGDLVDSKTKAEGSHQNEEEWKDYERVWRQLAQSAGLSANAILDLRGNHDAFDVLRNTGQDFFALYSATAAAHGQTAAASQRVWSYELQPQLLLPAPHSQHHHLQHVREGKEGHRRLTAATNSRYPISRNDSGRIVLLPGTHPHNSTGGQQRQWQRHTTTSSSVASSRRLSAAYTAPAAAAGAAAGSCPAAVLLGLDFTPNVGLHAPANFFGVASVELLQQVQQQLNLIRGHSSGSSTAEALSCRQSAPIVSYSHYPFSTVAASYATSSTIRQQRQQQREGGRAVRDLLMRYDVSAHVSGHLHDLVGQRLHAMFSKAGYVDEAGDDGGGVSEAPAAHFADLETADWKQARRWRLLVVDSGATSIADLRFKRTHCTSSSSSGCITSGSSVDLGSSSGYSYAVTSVDASRTITNHLAVLTWPADGRYGPLSAAAAKQQQVWDQQQEGDISAQVLLLPVRVWVAPLDVMENTGGSSSSSDIADVILRYSCQGMSIASAGTSGSRRMHPIGRSAGASSSSKQGYPYRLTDPQVFGTRIRLDPQVMLLQCGSSSSSAVVLQLQVTVTDSRGAVSTSELRPVQLSLAEWQQEKGDDQHPAAEGPLPLGNSLFEWLIIVFDGPAFGYWLFYTGWMCQFIGLLLLPRLFGRCIIGANAVLWKPVLASSNSSTAITSRAKLLLRYNRHQKQQEQQDDDEELISPVGRRISFDAGSPYKPCCGGSSSSGRFTYPILWLFKLMMAAVALLLQVIKSIMLQLLRLLLLPFGAMAVLARHHPGLWWCMVAHGLMVQWGPWFTAQMSSSSGGLGVWFRYGLLLPLPADLAAGWIGGDPLAATAAAPAAGSSSWQQWVWLPLPDTYLISSLYTCMILAPATLWTGLVVSAWHGAAAARHLDSSSSGGGIISTAAGEVELAAVPATEDVDAENAGCLVDGQGDVSNGYGSSGSISNNDCNTQERDLLASSNGEYGYTGGSSSSGTKRVLSRNRSNTQTRHRDASELPIYAAAAADGCESVSRAAGNAVASSSSSSSVLYNDVSEPAELEGLLPAAAATAAAVTPTAAAAGVLGGVTRTGSAWLINLLPLGVLPGAAAAALAPPAAAAVVTTPTKNLSSAAAAASAAVHAVISVSKPKLTPATLIPTLLWYLMGIVVLALRIIGRALQLVLVVSRLPAHLLLLLLPIACLWYKCCWRLGAAYGPVSLLVSPIVGWLPLFVFMALRHVRSQLASGRARRQE